LRNPAQIVLNQTGIEQVITWGDRVPFPEELKARIQELQPERT